MIVPPSPLAPVALAEMVASGLTRTCCARGPGPPPISVPPISAVPPPVAPETSTSEPSFSQIAADWMDTSPPWSPEARTVPVTCVMPVPPSTSIEPVCPAKLVASTSPPSEIVLSSSAPAASAEINTRPPSLRISPVLMTEVAPSSSSKASSPSPARSTANDSVPSRTTVPNRPAITPWFSTPGAASAASPASPKVIWPSLMIRASGLAGSAKVKLPSMKSPLSMSEVVASRPPTSTRAP